MAEDIRTSIKLLLATSILALGVAGCTTATVELADGTKVHFTRFASSVAFQLNPDGSLSYASDASQIAQQNANDALAAALRAALGAASPLPGLRSQPQAYRSLVRLQSPETGI